MKAQMAVEQGSFLSALSSRQRVRLSLASGEVKVRKRGFLFLAGDEADRVYILRAGRIKISRQSESGREVTLAVLEAGELIGLEILRGVSTRDTYATALEDCRLWSLSRDQFQTLLAEQPEMVLLVTRVLSERLLDSQETIERLCLRDVKARLASLLIQMAGRSGRDDGGKVRLAGRITHQDIAALIGSTRETTTATLNQFRRNQIIEFDRRQIIISGMDALEDMVAS